MSMKKIAVLCLILCVVGAFAIAQERQMRKIEVPKDIVQIKLKADLVVDWVWAEQCPCFAALAPTNTIFVDGSMGVVVTNMGPAEVTAKLTVKYFDKDIGAWQNWTKTFLFPKNKKLWVDVRFGEFLIRRSSGITAKIEPVKVKYAVEDPNMSNNVKTYRKCMSKALVK